MIGFAATLCIVGLTHAKVSLHAWCPLLPEYRFLEKGLITQDAITANDPLAISFNSPIEVLKGRVDKDGHLSLLESLPGYYSYNDSRGFVVNLYTRAFITSSKRPHLIRMLNASGSSFLEIQRQPENSDSIWYAGKYGQIKEPKNVPSFDLSYDCSSSVSANHLRAEILVSKANQAQADPQLAHVYIEQRDRWTGGVVSCRELAAGAIHKEQTKKGTQFVLTAHLTKEELKGIRRLYVLTWLLSGSGEDWVRRRDHFEVDLWHYICRKNDRVSSRSGHMFLSRLP